MCKYDSESTASMESVDNTSEQRKWYLKALSKLKSDVNWEERTLRASLLAAKQHSRSNNLDINGIPLTPTEKVDSVLHKLARIININMRKIGSLRQGRKETSVQQKYPPAYLTVARSLEGPEVCNGRGSCTSLGTLMARSMFNREMERTLSR
ncbi:hypothetical protein J6590_102318 [Homalodisca vitripennis]|nr:hypothetical protein J6590_102318 [Homalodisca vitripennis]